MTTTKKIGLIAGEGEFPLLFAQEARHRGVEVVTVAVKNHTSAEMNHYSDKIEWISLGGLKSLIQFFRQEKIQEAVMAGRVPKPDFIQGTVAADERLLAVLAKTPDHRDTTLINALISELERSGIRLLDSSLFLQSHLAKEGVLGKQIPSPLHREDIDLGKEAAKKLGELDIGQTVVVKNRAVVAVEGLEGTDETIRRAGKIAGEGIVVVKMARPSQDMRFDIPVVGPKTLETLSQAKAAVLAIEAGKTLMLQREIFLKRADESKLAVVGVKNR